MPRALRGRELSTGAGSPRRGNNAETSRRSNDDVNRELMDENRQLREELAEIKRLLAERNERDQQQSVGQDQTRGESREVSSVPVQRQTPSIEKVWGRVRKFDPPKFEGRMDPNEAIPWLEEMEKLFRLVTLDEGQKVLVAEQLMKKAAHEWWKNVRSHNEKDFSWGEFRKQFEEYYFPSSMRSAKESEFLSFKQGTMHEEEFIAKFLELSKFCRYSQNDSSWLCDRLIDKVRPDLRTALTYFAEDSNSFSRLCDKLRTVCRRKREEAADRAERRSAHQDRTTSSLRPTGGVSKPSHNSNAKGGPRGKGSSKSSSHKGSRQQAGT